jgi:hypothetical protein
MASPQKENGYTAINHESMEHLLLLRFGSEIPLQICLFILRKTWGYGKKNDIISLTQFQKATGASRPTVVYWLKLLVKHLLLVKGIQPTKLGYSWQFNKDWEQWKSLVKPLKLVKSRPFTSKTPLTATSKTPLTHKRKKENITKEILSSNDDGRDYNQILIKSPIRHIHIIGLYWSLKGIMFENRVSANKAIKREVKPASNLKDYNDERILGVMKYLEDTADYKWTLETVIKFIDEPKVLTFIKQQYGK